ncbi:polysaccharide export outer membrane protein [Parabacteroides sp. PF5-5]|uniref:polysaccharide biosynthesis/export family protein n=1 Tax=unclassified Parabacteroides TaxID=2649774 RepID=UPI002476D57B|nr:MULTISPECIES: polysaccharide biosynthesis/export family protein [unclassified Parabacteroides]MDH6306154.1 polysaccharide export outer membrane protein [Parabacteroides sp. PH5-39]MDH6317113.1 polysaccharide export outer membrane protein [Parabacteroides sp. PF5-13]MDH6320866.1 polysaccharide export outer membrane protein [Parabacteroides sp. PH5-13]MDH6324597.1 polysaccharide export outer membrane protein [Parabacteroides sp. PH5-8]MDH6328352.1 polysaccharide export outer membrane protein 
MKSKLLSVLLLISLLFSCTTPKDVLYFQGLDSLTKEQLAQMDQIYSSRIALNDLLSITVSAWDPTIVVPFNPPSTYRLTPGDMELNPSEYAPTYLVDSDGTITFPVIGKVQAAGLSKEELVNNLQSKISHYVKDPIVTVYIVNYKITFMGEVSRPGAMTVKNEKISLIDALGQAGDLTINANRKNILIIRDNNGVKEYGRVDLTDPAVFASPYYYLRQNDVIYVEPNVAKQRNARYSQGQQFSISIFSAIISALSLVTTIVVAAANM